MHRAAKTFCATLLLLSMAASGARGDCFELASSLYPRVPITWLTSVAQVESNFSQDALNKNKNGSIDVGTMQINSYWRPFLGEERWQLAKDDACYNVIVGAWVLDQCIERYGLTWKAVGCYNSPSKNNQLRYAGKVIPLINERERRRWSEYEAALAAAQTTVPPGGPEEETTAIPGGRAGFDPARSGQPSRE